MDNILYSEYSSPEIEDRTGKMANKKGFQVAPDAKPTQAQVCNWLEKEHGLFVYVEPVVQNKELSHGVTVKKLVTANVPGPFLETVQYMMSFDSKQKACEAGIYNALEWI